MINSMYSKLLVAIVALAASGTLMWLWKVKSGLQMTFYAALIALLVAIYWGLKYALLSGRLMINKSGHIEWNSSAGYGKGGAKADGKDAEPAAVDGAVKPPVDG